MMEKEILLILTGQNDLRVEDVAFRYAAQTAKGLVVLQILTSNLYHYGHHDVIATRPSKRQFLLHIRDEVLERGRAKAEALKERARREGIPIDVFPIETEDASQAAISEAQKGYDVIFLAKEKRKRFPLLEKTLAQHLEKQVDIPIIHC
jgi:hypothetical protein